MIPVLDHPDSVAVIGMAARLPGARDVTEFWRNLREGVESIVRHTPEEMLARGVRPDLLADPNYVGASGPLEDAECFDAQFFGYSAREASIIEPQHRVFLECAHHALEDAAYDPLRFSGTIGAYAGCTMNTYLLYNVMTQADDVVATVGDLQTMVGNDKDYLTTRVSHRLDLRGPSVTVQTACSSSLVAIHMACRALLDDECDMALAGGSSVRLPHAAGYLANPGGTSSPDGHCRAFDADAAGSVVGNGVGVVVLKRLAEAVRDGDRIRAVIRGSATNNDGNRKASFTAPSVDGQARAVVRALSRAGVSAADVRVIEAHGTGTPLGDPIEVAALTRGFRPDTDRTQYCWLGSAKTGIGHLDAAAGVAGLIKTVLTLEHRQVPPVVNFRRANPRLELETTPFRVATDLEPIDGDGPVLASVNSLAMGGTNAHVVLESAPPAAPATASARQRHAVLLSAHDPAALDRLSRSVGQWARENRDASAADLAYTLAVGRRQLKHRRVVTAGDMEDVASVLSTPGSRRQREGVVQDAPRIAFLFPGQGAQRLRMGVELAGRDATFAQHLDSVLDLFAERSGLDLREVLDPPGGPSPEAEDRIARTELTQPALFAVEWALGRTLLDYGVRPHAMLGHSVGELVAAALNDVLELPDAVDIVTLRGHLMGEAPDGAMLAVNLGREEVEALLDDERLAVAAVNGDELVTVSGPAEALPGLEERLAAAGVSHRRLHVTRAFHSPLMEPAAQQFGAALRERRLSGPTGLVVSDVTGDYLTAEHACDPQYWADQIRRPVLFGDGVRTLVRDGVTVFLEVGPGGSLRALVSAVVPAARSFGTVGDDAVARRDLLDVLADLWLTGVDCDWAAVYRGETRHRLALPLYPFARTRHWLDARSTVPTRGTDTPAATAGTPAVAPSSGAAEAPPDRQGWTPLQRYLGQLWSDLLGTERVGLGDNFFELGGHSLLAMQMITRLRKEGSPDIPMTTIFETPTLAQLSAYLEDLGMPAPPEGVTSPGVPTGSEHEPADGAHDEARIASLVQEIDALSDDEVRTQLADMEEGRA